MDEPEEQSLDYPVEMIPVGMKQWCMKHLDMSKRVAGATTHLFVNYCNCQTVVEAEVRHYVLIVTTNVTNLSTSAVV